MLSLPASVVCAPSSERANVACRCVPCKKHEESYIRMKKMKASCRNPGKSSYPLPPGKKKLRAPATYPDGLPVSSSLAFCRKVLVRRGMFENGRKNDKHNYTYVHDTYQRNAMGGWNRLPKRTLRNDLRILRIYQAKTKHAQTTASVCSYVPEKDKKCGTSCRGECSQSNPRYTWYIYTVSIKKN